MNVGRECVALIFKVSLNLNCIDVPISRLPRVVSSWWKKNVLFDTLNNWKFFKYYARFHIIIIVNSIDSTLFSKRLNLISEALDDMYNFQDFHLERSFPAIIFRESRTSSHSTTVPRTNIGNSSVEKKKSTPTLVHLHMRNRPTRSFPLASAVYGPEHHLPLAVRSSINFIVVY